jgi:hypothetical protein
MPWNGENRTGTAQHLFNFNVGRLFRASGRRQAATRSGFDPIRPVTAPVGAGNFLLDAARRIRRLKHRRGDAGPFLTEPVGGRRWVLIDFDKVPIPAHIDLVEDPVGAVEYFVGLLPDEFREVSYHWELSSSAGMGDPDVLSAHLWFCLDRPITEAELRRWARDD